MGGGGRDVGGGRKGGWVEGREGGREEGEGKHGQLNMLERATKCNYVYFTCIYMHVHDM